MVRNQEDLQGLAGVKVGTEEAKTPGERWKMVSRRHEMVTKVLSKPHMNIWDSSLF